MSDNLISKEKLFNSRPEWLNENMPDKEKSTYNKGWNACNNLWLDTINEQPTAYDVDDKVRQLELLKDVPHDDSVEEGISTRIWNKAIDNCIAIVKGGKNHE